LPYPAGLVFEGWAGEIQAKPLGTDAVGGLPDGSQTILDGFVE
jgi:hypothetical protein